MPALHSTATEKSIFPKSGFMVLAILFICGLGFLLKVDIGIPVKTAAPHDSELFFNWTQSLIAGQWLGPYNELTLTKGPMMSILAAMANMMGVPYKLVEHAIYILAIFVTATAAYKATQSAALSIVLSALLAFNPSLWSGEARTFMREPLYFTFALLTISLLSVSLLNRKLSVQSAVLTLLSGLCFGAYWYTREESIWIYPGLALVFSILYFQTDSIGAWIHRSVKQGLLFFFGFSTVALAITYVTWDQYGTLTTNVFRHGAFLEAMGSLQKIDAPSDSPYVPVSRKALEYAESASPTASQVTPLLKSSSWAQFGSNLPGKKADEISGASFSWALRAAAAQKGFHSSASAAESFYASLSREIELACKLKKIPCNHLNTGVIPRISLHQIPNFLSSTLESLAWILSIRSAEIDKPAWSLDRRGNIDAWRKTLGPIEHLRPKFSEHNRMVLSGWIASSASQVPAVSAPGAQHSMVNTFAAPDVDRYFSNKGISGLSATRFQLEAECPYETCGIKVGPKNYLLSDLDKPHSLEFATPDFIFHLDKVEFYWNEIDALQLLNSVSLKKLTLIEKLRKIYEYFIPILSVIAAIGVVAHGINFKRNSRHRAIFILTLAAAATILVRAAMVGYIDSTSWYAINVRNLLPGYGFAIIFGTFGSFLFIQFVKSTLMQRDAKPPEN